MPSIRLAGRCSQFPGSLGAQLGGQSYRQVILFRDEAAMATFKTGRIEFEGRASAVALIACSTTSATAACAGPGVATPC